MKKLAVLLSIATLPVFAEPASKRLDKAAQVLRDVMSTPEKAIPQELLEKAHCIVVIPGLKKGAIGIGGKYGRGFMSCRAKSGKGWGAPGAVRVEGGSFGFQLGGSSTDVVMLVMNQSGVDKLLSDKFTIGADASAAAGPVGRTASAATDAMLHAEILSYSRARGLFAGVSLEGATLRNDLDENQELYGKRLTNKEVIEQGLASPRYASKFIAELNKFSPREQGAGAGSGTTPTAKTTSSDKTKTSGRRKGAAKSDTDRNQTPR